MPIIEGYIVGVAGSLTVAVLQHWHDKQSRPSEEKALYQVYQRGFETMLRHAGQGLRQAELQTVATVLEDFLKKPDVAAEFLSLALAGQELDIDQLDRRFEETGGPISLQNIRFNFDRNLLIFYHSFTNALIAEASRQNSPISNMVTLNRLLRVQKFLEQVVELRPDAARQAEPVTETSTQYHSCFISYSTKDEEFVEKLYADLKHNGVRCWYAPEDMVIGNKIRQAIDDAIHGHEKLLVVLSDNSVKSDWVEKEVETAFDRERRTGQLYLFPVRLDNAVIETDLAWAADIRRQRHIGDLTHWKDHDSYRAGFERLLKDLRSESNKGG